LVLDLHDQLDQLSEAELEVIIRDEPTKADDARFVLGSLLIEGTNPSKVTVNDTVGINYIKTSAKNGHLPSIEY
jgi:hypothetical protein